MTSDLSQSKPMDILVKEIMLDNPNLPGGEAGAREYVANKYQLDIDNPDEWSTSSTTAMAIDANKAIKGFNELKSNITMPEQVSYEVNQENEAKAQEQILTQRIEGWSTVMQKYSEFDGIKSELSYKDNDVDLKFDFNFAPDDDFKTSVRESAEDYAKQGYDISEENVAIALEERDSAFLYENREKIFEQVAKAAISKYKEDYLNLLHNNQLPNTQNNQQSGGTNKNQTFANDVLDFIGTKPGKL